MSDGSALFEDIVAALDPLPEPERRAQAFAYVRDIPYGDIGSRDPYDVLVANKGTCSGKHALLRMVLESFGYGVQSWFAVHDFGAFPIEPWPAELAAFRGQTIPDYHDFLRLRVNEEWLTLDAIFDAPLRSLGFPVQDWDGTMSMSLPVHATETFQAAGPMEEHKKRLVAALPPDRQEARKEFLSSLTSWLDAWRAAE